MADEADFAQQYQDMQTSIAIQNAIQQNSAVQKSDICLNCYEPTKDGARFCDKDCADDYSQRRRFSGGTQ